MKTMDELTRTLGEITEKGCQGVCYDFAINASLFWQQKSLHKINDFKKLQDFSKWSEFGGCKEWSDEFAKSFEESDVLVIVRPDYADKQMYVQTHFMVALGGSWFAGINNNFEQGTPSSAEEIEGEIMMISFSGAPVYADSRDGKAVPHRRNRFVRIQKTSVEDFVKDFCKSIAPVEKSSCCNVQ